MSIKKIFFITTMILFAGFAFSQPTKIGHLNSGNLLNLMPEAKIANTTLDNFQKDLVAKGDTMVASFRADYEKYMKESSDGVLTAIETKQREAGLQQQQKELQDYQESMKTIMLQKRESLLKPILEKVDLAIQTFGKEEGYLMIFDESTGAMMYSLPSQDVTEQIKKKLGI